MDLFTSYETHTFVFPTNADEETSQTVLGWSSGGCNIVWSDLLPRVLAAHGEQLVGGKEVLELGAGCGLVGLLAARWAKRVDLTDGDEAEVALLAQNVQEHAPSSSRCCCSAQQLSWGAPSVAEAVKNGLIAPSYDVILAAQVVYVPEAIGALVETIACLLRDDGRCILYNDAVACTATQPECRALLDTALAAHKLRAEPVLSEGTGAEEDNVSASANPGLAAAIASKGPLHELLTLPKRPKGAVRWFPHADAYMLQITRMITGGE